MKTDILITIRAGCGKGKTTLAMALIEFLQGFGANIEIVDDDIDSHSYRCLHQQERIYSCLSGKNVKIITQQCNRNESVNGILEICETKNPTHTRWCEKCQSIRYPSEKNCLDCDSLTTEIDK